MIREVLGFLSEPIESDDYEEKDEAQEMEMDSELTHELTNSRTHARTQRTNERTLCAALVVLFRVLRTSFYQAVSDFIYIPQKVEQLIYVYI